MQYKITCWKCSTGIIFDERDIKSRSKEEINVIAEKLHKYEEEKSPWFSFWKNQKTLEEYSAELRRLIREKYLVCGICKYNNYLW